MAPGDSAVAPPAPTTPRDPAPAAAPPAAIDLPAAAPVPEKKPTADGLVLGMTRGDRLFGGVLATACLILLAIHWVRLTGWGVRPVEIDRHEPRSFAYHLDLNTANWVELSQLPEIGEALARAIVDDRTQRGPFHSVDDLRRVKRIGPKTIEKLRPWVKAEAPQDR